MTRDTGTDVETKRAGGTFLALAAGLLGLAVAVVTAHMPTGTLPAQQLAGVVTTAHH